MHSFLIDGFRMSCVTLAVSASSFIADMCIKQNAVDYASVYPIAAKAVENSFYVNDGLTGPDSIEGAIDLCVQLQALFNKGGFLLRKWNSSEMAVLQQIEPELRDQQTFRTIAESDDKTKIEWNEKLDHFRLTVADFCAQDSWTKRTLASDIAKTFDVFGWFAPVIIKAKIFLQRLWEVGLRSRGDPVPAAVEQAWLGLLVDEHIPRCYHPKEVKIAYRQLHGFSDASGRMLELCTFVLWTLLVASTPLLSWQRQRWLLSRGSLYLPWNSPEHFSLHNYFNIVRRYSVSLLKTCVRLDR